MDNNSDLSQQAQDHQSSSQINAQTILSDNNIRSFNRQLFIGDLPYAVQDVHIWNLFSAYGRIERIDLKRNKKDYFCTLRGYGFVTMETHEQAALALANLDKKPFFGRVIKVAWGHSGERQGSQAVGGGGGESLDSSTFATDNCNKSNDCGNGSYLETTNNRVDSNSCSETTKSSSQLELTMGSSLAETHVHYKNINSVYVKFSCFDFNISINEMSLTEVFSRFGEVIDVSIKNISIYGHALTGFAFIHFADSLEGRDAARNCAKALANKIEGQ
jgi:RNA recognition motif-containing protein